MELILIDDQPIEATFFHEGRWLTDFITPDAMEVQTLFAEITDGVYGQTEKITACWEWVTSQVQYVRFVKGKLWIAGKVSVQNDLWTMPETTINTRVGNCAVKSFLLASLIRNELLAEQVYCVLGNLYNGKPGGHAWVGLRLDDDYIMESTQPNVPPLVPVSATQRYEAIHLFNDQSLYTIPGKTVMKPYTACFSPWLEDYLDFAYIEGRK